jgi:cytoskeletal protein RodZ
MADDIGSTLREARMRARIDVSEVEARTKIRAKYLRAIENEEWDLLPGTVYAKSFLRTYSDFLGLDSRSLLDEFKRRYEGPSDHDALPVATLGRERERRARGNRLPSWAPVGIVVAAVVALLFIVGLTQQGSSPTPVHHAHGPAHPAPTVTSTPTVTPAAPTFATLSIVPTGALYVCLVNGAGKKLINQQIFTAGQTIRPERARKLLLTLGNASVTMTANGRAYAVSPSAKAIRLEITAAGVAHVPLSTKPTCP